MIARFFRIQIGEIRTILCGTILWLILFNASFSAGGENHQPEVGVENGSRLKKFSDEILSGTDFLIKSVGGGSFLETDITSQPNAQRYTLFGEFRPDFYLNYKNFSFTVKPRIFAFWEDFEEENDSDVEFFVNEWQASVYPTQTLFASYGRENLQWGPSYLFSPSNPFFKDNGRTNPLTEIPGMDFAKAIWILNPTWTLSFLANTDEGRQVFPFGFENTYALKLDFTQERQYLTLIGSKKEVDRGRFGGYAGWTMTDALMLHTEWEIFNEVNPQFELSQLRKLLFPDTPVDSDVEKYTNHNLEGVVLVGASNTLMTGPTFTLEYVYNGAGFTDDEADLIFKGGGSSAISPNDRSDSLLPQIQENTVIPESKLFRKNYLMVQYQQVQIWNRLNLLFRYVYNLDDQSSRFTSIITCDVGDHMQLNFTGKKNFGSDRSEFPFLFDHSITIGFEYTF